MVTVVIDGKPHQFPKGTERCSRRATPVGADVPFFCYHPGLSSPAVCRQCLVDVKGQPKPVPSCYTPVADKMEVDDQVAAARWTCAGRCSSSRCSTTRSTARSATRPASALLQKHYFDWDAQARAQRRHQGPARPRSSTSARTSCSTRSAASCARAASACATRSRRTAPARDGPARRPRGADHGARAASSTTRTRSTPSTSARSAR